MNTGTLPKGSRRTRVVQTHCCCRRRPPHWSSPAVAVVTEAMIRRRAATAAAAAAAVIRDAQFVDDIVSGLRFSVTGIGEGVTDAAGKFQFVDGRKIDFLAGGATNRIALGSATPTYTTGVVPFSLQDFDEVRAPNGDAYLANLLRLLVLLDANNDTTDGFQIDAAANTAISAAVTGTKTLDFAASAAAFAADATITALATALNRTLVGADEALVRYQLLFRQSRSSSIAKTRRRTSMREAVPVFAVSRESGPQPFPKSVHGVMPA